MGLIRWYCLRMPRHGIRYLDVSLDWAVPWVSLDLADRCIATLPSPSPSGFRRASPPLAIGTAWRREALGPGLRESGTRRGEAGATRERVSILRSYKTTNNTPRPRSVHSGEGAYRTTHTHTRARSGPTVHARSTGRSPHVSLSSHRSRQRWDITRCNRPWCTDAPRAGRHGARAGPSH